MGFIRAIDHLGDSILDNHFAPWHNIFKYLFNEIFGEVKVPHSLAMYEVA